MYMKAGCAFPLLERVGHVLLTPALGARHHGVNDVPKITLSTHTLDGFVGYKESFLELTNHSLGSIPHTFLTTMAAPSDAKWLVFGETGWIGGMVIDLLKAKGANVFGAKSRLDNREDVAR